MEPLTLPQLDDRLIDSRSLLVRKSKSMQRVILLRHGQSEINAAHQDQAIFCGQLETRLTNHGRQQARDAGRLLADPGRFRIRHAVSSTLDRAVETLDLVLESFVEQPETYPSNAAFNERSLGLFEGRTEDEVFRQFPAYQNDPTLCNFRADFQQKAPGGENLEEVTTRAWDALQDLMPNATADLLIVTHCQTIRCLIARMTQLDPVLAISMKIPHAVPFVLSKSSEFTWELADTCR